VETGASFNTRHLMGIKRKVQERNCAIAVAVAARRRRGRLIYESRKRPWRRRRISRNGNTQALPLSSNLRHLRTPAGRVGIYGKLSFRRRKFARARVDYLSVTRETRAMRRTRVKYPTRDCDLVAVVHSAKRNSRERVSSSRLPSGRTEADE